MSVLKQYADMPDSIDILSKDIVDIAFQIHKEMGPGLSESIYEDCFVYELNSRNLNFERQRKVDVFYKGALMPSKFYVDLLIENKIVVELKTVEKLLPIHQGQIMSYMKLIASPLGFLINFNVPLIKDGIKRIAFSEKLSNFASSR